MNSNVFVSFFFQKPEQLQTCALNSTAKISLSLANQAKMINFNTISENRNCIKPKIPSKSSRLQANKRKSFKSRQPKRNFQDWEWNSRISGMCGNPVCFTPPPPGCSRLRIGPCVQTSSDASVHPSSRIRRDPPKPPFKVGQFLSPPGGMGHPRPAPAPGL